MIVSKGYHYDQRFCLIQCTQELALKNCNCTYPNKVSLFENATECNYLHKECSRKIFESPDDHIANTCMSLCPLECNTTQFKASLSQIKLLGDFYLNFIRERENLAEDFVSRQLNEETARESVVRISIFYDKLGYTHSSESAKVTMSALLAYLGGTLSLFLGVSMLSACELVYVLIEMYYIIIKSKACIELAPKENKAYLIKTQKPKTVISSREGNFTEKKNFQIKE